MASTYSGLKLQLMATGENAGTWGEVTNLNLGTALEEAIVGTTDVTFDSDDVTLTLTDSNSSQPARHMRLNLVGTTGGDRSLIVPATEKCYIVNNTCADDITVKNATGTGTTVPTGKSMFLYNDGTDVSVAVDFVPGGTTAETADRWTTARNFTIGDRTVSVNGSANYSWSLSQIGAQEELISGTNIRTINGQSLLGSGNIDTGGSSGGGVESVSASSPLSASGTTAVSLTLGTVPVSKGGTGRTSLTSGRYLVGNGTSSVTLQNGIPGGDVDSGISASNITTGTLSANRLADESIGAEKLKSGTIASSVALNFDTTVTFVGDEAGAEFRSTSAKYPVVGINTGNFPGMGVANVPSSSGPAPAFVVGAATNTTYGTFRTSLNCCSYTSAMAAGGDVTIDGDLVVFGTISPFTGSHLCLIQTPPEVGDIVVDTGEVQKLDVSNSVGTVAQSSSAEMQSVAGVYIGTTDIPDMNERVRPNPFNDVVLDGKSWCTINAVGEGLVNVIGENGDIAVGDLIVTSSTPGKGMKQTDGIVRNITVGKAREAVTFTSPTEEKQIACIYMCG